MEYDISGFLYDLSQPVKLLTTSNKYWKATLNGKKLIIEVGKVKAGVDEMEKDVTVDNATVDMAKSSMVAKIKEKLVKGYYSAMPVKEKKPEGTLKRKTRSASKINATPGGFLEKGGESTMFEIADNKIRVTRTGGDGKKKV